MVHFSTPVVVAAVALNMVSTMAAPIFFEGEHQTREVDAFETRMLHDVASESVKTRDFKLETRGSGGSKLVPEAVSKVFPEVTDAAARTVSDAAARTVSDFSADAGSKVADLVVEQSVGIAKDVAQASTTDKAKGAVRDHLDHTKRLPIEAARAIDTLSGPHHPRIVDAAISNASTQRLKDVSKRTQKRSFDDLETRTFSHTQKVTTEPPMDNAQTPTNPATAAIRQVGLRQFTDPGHIAMEQKITGPHHPLVIAAATSATNGITPAVGASRI